MIPYMLLSKTQANFPNNCSKKHNFVIAFFVSIVYYRMWKVRGIRQRGDFRDPAYSETNILLK